jgi:hypothetical protein
MTALSEPGARSRAMAEPSIAQRIRTWIVNPWG